MEDDIHITYCLTERIDERAIQASVEQLSADEHARYGRFVFERDRRDFAVAHALLRRSLSARGDLALHEWTFTSGPHGKPALSADLFARTQLSFNLAHTDGLVACVVARHAELGLDVETIDRRVTFLEVADRFFSPAEIDQLKRCTEAVRPVRFIEIWTLKEAYVKALGQGLSCPLHEFAFVLDGGSALGFEASGDSPPMTWRFALFAPSIRHRMAVAIGSESAGDRRLEVRVDSSALDHTSRMPVPFRISHSSRLQVTECS